MERKPKDLNYDVKMLESLGATPFTLRKDSLNEDVITWTTTPSHYSEDMQDRVKRVNYVFGNLNKIGVDEMIMPDQPKVGERCHELTYEEVLKDYKTSLAHNEGSIWNIDRNYDSIFMTRETHYRIMEDMGRSISLTFPAGDCAIVRVYDKEKDIIGLTHSGIAQTTTNIIGDMISYMKEHFNSNIDDIKVFVGAFAHEGMIWDKYPPFAEENPEVWKDYIKKIDDNHYDILFGNKIYDQLIETGLKEDNIYFDPDNTVKNKEYFSNNRIKLLKERMGRNLFGITFDGLPIYENVEKKKAKTRLK